MVNALQYCHEDAVTVINGDTLFDIDHERLCRFAEEKDTSLAIVLRQVPDAGRYGSVEIDANGCITTFKEKNAEAGSGLINGGIYRIQRILLDGFTLGEKFSFEQELMQQRYRDERYYAYADGAYFLDIGIPEDYSRAQQELPSL